MERKTYSEDFKRKAVELSNKTSITKAARELGVAVSSISNWRKVLINKVSKQDHKGVLIFSLDMHTYSLKVNSEEERDSVLKQINLHSKHSWGWFKEETGKTIGCSIVSTCTM